MNLKKYGKNRILTYAIIGGMFLLSHPFCYNNYESDSKIYNSTDKKIQISETKPPEIKSVTRTMSSPRKIEPSKED